MSNRDQARRLAPYAQELLENEYVQQNLRDSVEKLRAAYGRVQKRRVEPTRDERLRRQLVSAGQSMAEAARALRSGRRKPERHWRTRLMVVGGLAGAGAATAFWASKRLEAESQAESLSDPAATPAPEEPTSAPAPA